jgi:hypothetical protein
VLYEEHTEEIRSMKNTIAALLALALAAAPVLAGTPAAKAPVTWPDTRVGALARDWVTAFNTGEDAMRGFLADHMAAKTIAERGVPSRVERYRTLRDQYGRLQLDRVVESSASELTVKLLDGDAKSREFTFRSEAQEPWKIVSVSIKEAVPGIHGLFGGFHH